MPFWKRSLMRLTGGEFCSSRAKVRARTRAAFAANRLPAGRLMQSPLGAAFARKVLRCKARDEGRTLVLFDEARNAAAGHFSCKPFGAVLGGAPWGSASACQNAPTGSELPDGRFNLASCCRK